MNFEEFKKVVTKLIERSKFLPLLKNPIKPGSPAFEYLESRELPTDVEAYSFYGGIEYQGKPYNLEDSIVIPMRGFDGELRGVWIRSLYEKKFFIWVTNPDHQKFWADIRDPEEPIVIAESIFDALSLRKLFGFKNIAAALGAKVSGEMIETLNQLGNQIILAFDNDSAGYRGMLTHLGDPKTQHWSILVTKPKNFYESIDLAKLKDYNDLVKSKIAVDFEIKRGIQAKVYLKSKL